jgi:hypothetical protein
VKEGCLTWQEFLDFFFARGVDPIDRLGHNNSDWWFKIDQDGKPIQEYEPTPRVAIVDSYEDEMTSS